MSQQEARAKSIRWGGETTTTASAVLKGVREQVEGPGTDQYSSDWTTDTSKIQLPSGFRKQGSVDGEDDDDDDHFDYDDGEKFIPPENPASPLKSSSLKFFEDDSPPEQFAEEVRLTDANPRDPYVLHHSWHDRFSTLDGEKSYFKIFEREEHFLKPTRYTQPMHAIFLHSAKVTETGRLLISGITHFTFSITSIGKSKKTASGPKTFVYHLACRSRKDVRDWSKMIGKVILKIADLPSVSHRIRKASRHKVNKDWKSAHLVIKGGSKGDYSRRKPSTEIEPDNETPRMKVQPIAVPSVTLHASDHRWKLGSNNFTKTPKRPKTQTAAEMIPNYIIKAIFKNDLDEILVWLTSHRAFDGMEARSGERLLHTACSCGNLNLAIFFLDKGAKPDVKDGYGETPLYSCVKNRNVKIAELLLQRGAEINDGADDGVTPLALACANGDLKMVHFLLDCGANPMTPDIRGISPFFTACAQGHLEVVKVLLQMNQKIPGVVVVEKKTNNDLTPIYASAQRGCLEIVKLLVKMGAKWDEPNLQVITPFHAAVERGELAVCEYLLSLDPPSDAFKTNSTDMSCLHTAAKFNRVGLLEFLLELGLDLNATDMYGATPLDCARSFGHLEAAKEIEKLGGIRGEDYLRDPKSRAQSVLAKHRMVGAGMGDGRVFSRAGNKVRGGKISRARSKASHASRGGTTGTIRGILRDGEVFGIDDEEEDEDQKGWDEAEGEGGVEKIVAFGDFDDMGMYG